MKVSLSWLKAYVPIEMSVADLSEALTMAGLEVASVSNRYAYLDTVFVGRITAVNAHPNADKLTLCRVDLGERQVSVVCGAPNVKTGMLSPLALPGTPFPAGFILEKSTIRGQASEGMLCSEAELGLGPDASGIMPLDPLDPEDAAPTPGMRLAEALNLDDTLLEIDLTPNRPDCLSVLGIAREIAAIQKSVLQYPQTNIKDAGNAIERQTSVTILAPDHCPRYSARLVEGITVAPSPQWLQERLLSVGMRPINNIVDITNFVLMELGQPLHAFDFDHLAQNRIVVRTADQGETFTTLDEKERQLEPQMLMICDGEKPVGVAGVMGGLNSEIEETTTRVLIESAYFNPVSIRKTSKKLGLSTEASYRFERGIDPLGVVAALNRAARLMVELGGGRLVDGLIDENPIPYKMREIPLSAAKTNRLLGTRLERDEIGSLLKQIEFKVKKSDDPDLLTVIPSAFRVDVLRPEDLMEEVARLWGYNRISTTFPAVQAEGRTRPRLLDFRRNIKQLMAGVGFNEVITYSFIHKKFCDRLRLDPDDPRRSLVAILNPLIEDQAVMRSSLIPGLLETMAYNYDQQNRNLKIFELGMLFFDQGAERLPQEKECLAGLWTGARAPESWHTQATACDFYDIKGLVEGLLSALKIEGVRFTRIPAAECRYTRPGHSARILADSTLLGLVGEVDPGALHNFNLKQTAFIFELDLAPLLSLWTGPAFGRPIPKFPAIFRDITLIIDKSIEVETVLDSVTRFGEELVEQLHLFAVYEGEPIAAGKKSISFRVVYRAADKTLVDEDVSQLHKSITQRLLKRFDATLP